jgi:hypothetical protein
MTFRNADATMRRSKRVWRSACRRLAQDWQASIASAEAWRLIGHIRTLIGRLHISTPGLSNFEAGSWVCDGQNHC